MSRGSWVRALASAVAAAAMAGCATTSTPTPSPSATTLDWSERGPVTLLGPHDSTGTVAADIAEWNQAHPNEIVIHEDLPTGFDQRHAQLLSRLQGSSTPVPTLITTDAVWLPELADKGWVAALPANAMATDGLVASAVAAGTVSGKTYGIPITVSLSVLYYRTDLLAAAGISSVPRTWQDLTAACTRILAVSANADMGCFGEPLARTDDATGVYVEAIRAAGGEVLNNGVPVVTTPEAVRGLAAVGTAVKTNLIPAAAKSWKSDDARTAFLDGRLVFLRHWSSAWLSLTRGDAVAKVADRVGIAVLPGFTGAGIATIAGDTMAIATAGPNKATALAFLAWLNDPERQRVHAVRAGWGPLITALYNDGALAAQAPFLSVVATGLGQAKALPTLVRYADLSVAVQNAGSSVLDGKDASSAALELQTQIQALIG